MLTQAGNPLDDQIKALAAQRKALKKQLQDANKQMKVEKKKKQRLMAAAKRLTVADLQTIIGARAAADAAAAAVAAAAAHGEAAPGVEVGIVAWFHGARSVCVVSLQTHPYLFACHRSDSAMSHWQTREEIHVAPCATRARTT